ncbi:MULTISPECIES: thiol-disulfide oxidoreductase DCC family protein [unclassified Acinetobacter]|uniref:thiol-disulfide oxidoreductase DCC family protein n=1 Tax=unclassified Acinetobacter TaxID=196816 RepID=UPI0035B9C84B
MKVTMFYDADCILCSAEAKALVADNPADIEIVPVNDAVEELQQAGISYQDAMTYLCVRDEHGNWHTHMDAVRLLYRTAGWNKGKWLGLPVLKQVSDAIYPIFARNRYRFPQWFVRGYVQWMTKTAVPVCDGGSCQINPQQRQIKR